MVDGLHVKQWGLTVEQPTQPSKYKLIKLLWGYFKKALLLILQTKHNVGFKHYKQSAI